MLEVPVNVKHLSIAIVIDRLICVIVFARIASAMRVVRAPKPIKLSSSRAKQTPTVCSLLLNYCLQLTSHIPTYVIQKDMPIISPFERMSMSKYLYISFIYVKTT